MGWLKILAYGALKGSIAAVCLPIKLGIDVVDIGVDVASGNWVGAGVSTAFFVANVFTAGQASTVSDMVTEAVKEAGKTAGTEAAKDVAVEAGKQAISVAAIATFKETAKQTAKEASKIAGQEAAKDIAKGKRLR
jgi:hypothetical protein